MASLSQLVFATVLVCGSTVTIKMGGHLQDSYLPAFNKFVVWANTGTAAYNVTTNFTTFSSTTQAADVLSMTTAGSPNYVDVLVCPYGSTNVKACVSAVNNAYTGPVMAWGGASDAIFDTNCAALTNKNCFGFFTVASKYTETGLVALAAKVTGSATAKVAVISNSNGFSKSVATGANATIGAQAKLEVQSYTTLSVAKAAITTGDTSLIAAALGQSPDFVVITGHNKDVEPAIIAIGKGNTVPKAILATNGVSVAANYNADSKYAKCILMPTQWDSAASTKDAIVGWSSADFTTAMGGSTTYQNAAAGAVGVAIANALAINSDKTTIAATLKAMDKDSFYGKLKWDAKGKIQKPMYTVQGTAKLVVAPTGTMKYPLTSADCWGTANGTSTAATAATSSTGTATSSACSQVFSVLAVLSMLLVALMQ